MSASKKIFVSVTNDLVTDQRVNKVCNSLHMASFEVHLLGRVLKKSPKLEKRKYSTKRFRLFFEKGPFFYLSYNLYLFLYLIRHKPDILLSNDLDTLPANYLASKLLDCSLVYDSHEYYTEVPELINRKRVRRVWESIESWILPNIDSAYTVSHSIAEEYKKKYGIKMRLVRNFPVLQEYSFSEKVRSNEKLIIYQGALNVHRGIEFMVEAMQWVKNAKFIIVGSGDIEEKIKQQIDLLGLNQKVKMLGRKNLEDLRAVTIKADLGISLEEKKGLNYTYALPNKLFDYIHARVPVLATDLPEVSLIFKKYEVGRMINTHQPIEIANAVNSMLESQKINFWKEQCQLAAVEYNWQNEEKTLLSIFKKL